LFISDNNIENVYTTKTRARENILVFPEENCFEFDFLNDEMWVGQMEGLSLGVILERIKNKKFDIKKLESLLPPALLEIIIYHPDQLIIYINPPYAEAGNSMLHHEKRGKKEVEKSLINKIYKHHLGKASHELFAQFLMRIYQEIPNCKIGNFSKLKTINAPNFTDFRRFFLARFEKGFMVPAETFENVSGDFPIAFQC